MLFNSGEFLVLFVAVWLLYRVLPHRAQNRLLLAASYVFYGYWDPRFLGLIFVSTVVDYGAGLGIERCRAEGRPEYARRFVGLSVAVNLGILGFFKYWNFFADEAAALLSALGLGVHPWTLDILLPAGISFYTFQTLGYTIDVYRGRVRAARSFEDFALFVAFFPQLMAGPIERARSLLPQIQSERPRRDEDLGRGAWLVLWGLFKKVFIADNLAVYVAWARTPSGATTGLDVYLLFFAFAVTFYCDFSGYSDMARGLARLFGIRISNNFALPYWAANPTQLWQRWHITLARWFRDYVYGPLSRSWRGAWARDAAAFASLTLVGLWHGAAWTFVLWGACWGALLVAHRRLRPGLKRLATRVPVLGQALGVGGALFTFHAWMLVGVFFVADGIAQALFFQRIWLTDTWSASAATPRDALTVFYFAAPVILVQVVQRARGRLDFLAGWPRPARVGVYVLLVFLLVTQGAERGPAFFYYAF